MRQEVRQCLDDDFTDSIKRMLEQTLNTLSL